MRVISQNLTGVNFGKFYVLDKNFYNLSSQAIKETSFLLDKTKKVDLLIDSKGFAIKDLMTGIHHRIQSFSLYPKEKMVSINVSEDRNIKYKKFFKTLDEAKQVWKDLYNTMRENRLAGYTKSTLWIDEIIKN